MEKTLCMFCNGTGETTLPSLEDLIGDLQDSLPPPEFYKQLGEEGARVLAESLKALPDSKGKP